jgi:hypothetical protein
MENENWIELSQDMGYQRAFVNTMMHLRVPGKQEISLPNT